MHVVLLVYKNQCGYGRLDVLEAMWMWSVGFTRTDVCVVGWMY